MLARRRKKNMWIWLRASAALAFKFSVCRLLCLVEAHGRLNIPASFRYRRQSVPDLGAAGVSKEPAD